MKIMETGKHLRKLPLIATAAMLGLTVAGALLPRVRAAQAKAAATQPGTIPQPYVHLYSDSNGVSHFRDEVLSIAPNATGPARLVLSQTPGAGLLALAHGHKEDWHRAPLRMYLVVLQGMSEVTAGDGQVRRFGPGSILLMDDLTGKGHITRAVGPVDHVAFTVPAPAAP